METLTEVLEKRDITFSLCRFDERNILKNWEIQIILDNADVFTNLHIDYPLNAIDNLDDYILYLLSIKLSSLKEYSPELSDVSCKSTLLSLADASISALSKINKGDVIKYINSNIEIIFAAEDNNDIRSATIDVVTRYIFGISDTVLQFLCQKHPHFVINRFSDFEKLFERKFFLFESLFPLESLYEISIPQLEAVLDIWSRINGKSKSNLKPLLSSRIQTLYASIKNISDTATIDNVLQIEGIVRNFSSFLKDIHSPLANDFAQCEERIHHLLVQHLDACGHVFTGRLPVDEIIQMHKNQDIWQLRLLSTTHVLSKAENRIVSTSLLDTTQKVPHPFLDLASTNIATDSYFTFTHQLHLSAIATTGSATFFSILHDQELLYDYFNMVLDAISFIEQSTDSSSQHLSEDFTLLSKMIILLVNNIDNKKDFADSLCYGPAVFSCTLAEKILRVFYCFTIKDKCYVPVETITLGDLLNEKNTEMKKLLGANHMKNLLFFLQHSGEKKIGRNYRNRLAHWSNVSPELLSIKFISELLWLFTDIFNSVFSYFLFEPDHSNDTVQQ